MMSYAEGGGISVFVSRNSKLKGCCLWGFFSIVRVEHRINSPGAPISGSLNSIVGNVGKGTKVNRSECQFRNSFQDKSCIPAKISCSLWRLICVRGCRGGRCSSIQVKRQETQIPRNKTRISIAGQHHKHAMNYATMLQWTQAAKDKDKN